MLFILTTTYIFLNLEDVRYPVTVVRNTKEALLALEGYQYKTDERSGAYTISFHGHTSEGRLLGRIPEYEIYIYQEKEELYVRNENAEDWVTASHEGLENIQCFLMGPADIMQHILDLTPSNMYFGEDGLVIHIPYKQDEDSLAKIIFPGISDSAIADFHVILVFVAEDRLQKIEMTLELLLPDSTEEVITRNIFIDYSPNSPYAYPGLNI